MTEVRHFLGSDPCAKPAAGPHSVYLATVRTVAGVRQGQVYRYKTDELEAVLSQQGRKCYVIAVTRSGQGGTYNHEERFPRVNQAVDRWFELCKAA